jgi:hypothetical protein
MSPGWPVLLPPRWPSGHKGRVNMCILIIIVYWRGVGEPYRSSRP